jgi:hypothetical protein
MTQYGTSTAVSFTAKKGFTKSRSGVRSREQKGLVTHPDSGPELKLYSKPTSLRERKTRAIKASKSPA